MDMCVCTFKYKELIEEYHTLLAHVYNKFYTFNFISHVPILLIA